MSDKQQRQAALVKVLRNRPELSQHELADLLTRKGVRATQAGVSRDLRELGLLKIRGKYVTAEQAVGRSGQFSDGLDTELVTGVSAVGANIVIVRTRSGAANAFAFTLDEIACPDIAGTIAGDDTIFIAVASRAAQGRVVAMLKPKAALVPAGWSDE